MYKMGGGGGITVTQQNALYLLCRNIIASLQPRTQALLFFCRNIYTILQLYIEIKYTILQLYKEISIASAQGCLGRMRERKPRPPQASLRARYTDLYV